MKNLRGFHVKIVQQLDECLQEGSILGWMTKIKTVLSVKDPERVQLSSDNVSCFNVETIGRCFYQ